MAGVLIVDDRRSKALAALPHRYGVDDLPLILQGAPLPVGRGDGARRPLLVNGTPNAVHRTSARRVRLRLVNGTGGAILGVSVRGARAVRQVGSDGGLLPAPIAGANVVLGPSERVELVVDMRAGARVALRSTILEDRGASAAAEQTAFLRGVADPNDTGTLLTIVYTS
jgi:FtsP/CotA-like multicopper oxidase with cupredoxin domain